jgi:hypothetical protein
LVKKTEWRWVAIFAAALVLITSLPYLAGYALQGSAWRFSGFIFGVEDGNSYIAKMLAGASGEWLFKTPYSAYPQAGILAFLPYLLLGKLTSNPGQHEQLVALFQIFRCAALICLVFATYSFLSKFIERLSNRRFALALITFGGGLGWLAAIGFQSLWNGRIPLEFYSPESFGFLAILGLPHLAMGKAFLLWGLIGFFSLPHAKSEWKYSALNGFFWLVSALMQPVMVLTGLLILGLSLILSFLFPSLRNKIRSELRFRLIIKRVTWITLFIGPILIYTAWSFLTDPYLIAWSAQNIITSPPAGDYLMAYSLLLPLVIFGIYIAWKEHNWKLTLLFAWVATFPFLAYAPVNIQRRLPDGVWIGLTILAIFALERIENKLAIWIRRALYTSFFSSVFFLAGAGISVLKPSQPIYFPVNIVEAGNFISRNSSPGDVILAGYQTSNILPTQAYVRTLIGHGPESIHLNQILPMVKDFYKTETTDEVRLALINEFKIRLIMWGPEEKNFGDWDPNQSPLLTLIYQKDDYTIFSVHQ